MGSLDPAFVKQPLLEQINLNHPPFCALGRLDRLRAPRQGDERELRVHCRTTRELTVLDRGPALSATRIDLSGEDVVRQWVENPYRQVLTGEMFQPIDPSSVTRKRVGRGR
jgi:IS5 family transposase